MSNYMPTMIAFKRKRSGWKRRLENILIGFIILLYLAVLVGTTIFTYRAWHWNPTIPVIGELVAGFYIFNGVHKFVYDDDSGLHNLEGYDPETHTVPELEAQGFDTQKFTTRLPKRRRW